MNTWTKICRACLCTKESFTNVLFENVPPELYYFCTSIEINQDELPRALCNLCFELLTKYSEFKKTCIQSQHTLLNILSSRDPVLNGTKEKEHNKEINLTVVKTENFDELVNFQGDIFGVKEEVISGRFDEEFFASIDFSDIPNKKRLKRRKIKKAVKQKVKSNLKAGRKLFNFSCEVCNKKFNYEERFQAHQLEHEGKEVSIHCVPCNKTFMTWSGLRRHNESEHTMVSLKKLKCTMCGKICKSRQTLQMHKKTHGERKMFVCDVCGKGFTTKFILKAHLETHKENRERLFTCEHCGKKFYTNTILLSHVSRLHTGRRYICQVCSYPFTDKYNLAKHLLIHDGKKLFRCEICNKSYTTQSSLVEHKRIHSGERPYMCNYCPKSFLSKRRLDDHHKIHTGERPHKCGVCEQGFTQRGTLKRHMKVHDRMITVPTSNLLLNKLSFEEKNNI